MSIPAALMIDDGACINLMHWLEIEREHPLHIPAAFTSRYAAVCRRYGVKGKFSVLPIPSGAGRIDTRVSDVSSQALEGFLRVMRDEIAPFFDITPEILTHQAAIDIRTGAALPLNEDEWFCTATLAEMIDYFCLAFRILRNTGLYPNGVTSPWQTGIQVERLYAEAIGRAYHRVTRRTLGWYFLHCLGAGAPRHPWVSWCDSEHGLTVISVPALTSDVFWDTQYQGTQEAARRVALEGADQLLTPDGRHGRLRELYDRGFPLIILTHWQSLFSRGWEAGLDGLSETFARMQRVFGEKVTWMQCSEIAGIAARRARDSVRE